MKFIGGIHTFKIVKGQIDIKIPSYHRAGAGLITGTKVYVYPRKTENWVPNTDRKLDIREVIISLFNPKNWTHIWKLEINAIDRPGLTRKITQILKNLRVNIFIQESLIANYDQDFTVSIIADFENYFKSIESEFDKKINQFSIIEIYEKIREEFSFEGTGEDFGINIQKFEPIRFLTNISENEVLDNKIDGKDSKNLIDKDKLRNFYENARPVPVNNLGITLERHLLSVLEIFGVADSSSSKIQGTIFSDTEEKYIIIRFFSPDQLVAHLEVIHRNHVGAINAFTEAIQETHNEYNIISCYNRIEDDTHFAHWHVLIDVTKGPEKLPSLIKKLGDIPHIPDIEVKSLSYSESLINEGIGRLPESERQKKEKFKPEVEIEDVNNILDEKIEKIRLEFEEQNNKDLIKAKSNLIIHKKEHLKTLKQLQHPIQLSLNQKSKQHSFILISIPTIYYLILFCLTVLLGWEKMDPVVSFLGFGGFILSYIYLVVYGQSMNPKKYFDKKKEFFKDELYKQYEYKEENIAQLESEIQGLELELEITKT